VAIIFYRLFLWLYTGGARLLSPFNRKARLWLRGRKGIFQSLEQLTGNGEAKIIWLHCASLGEFEQGRPLLENIRKRYPGYRVLLTFFSPSGYEVRKECRDADYICYLPMDSASGARQFISIVQPALVLWVKYEYWYFYLGEIKKNNIPLLLVSGIFRDDQPFFKWYGNLHRKMLSCFSFFFVQNNESKKLLGKLGFSENVTVSGDTRFDRVIEIAGQFQPIAAIAAFINQSPVIVAGSTWEEDEEELGHFANIHQDIKFIIAPHEIDEEHLKDIEKLFRHCIRYSNLVAANRDTITDGLQAAPNVLLIDNIGMLSSLYQYATITYVGGGFGDDGVHNVLEAAVFGKPVIFGPVYEKFREAVDLEACGGAFSIENALELEETLLFLLRSNDACSKAGEAAKDYVYSNKGATEKILELIQEKRLLTN
jgi:3-deoxy-D-manno-octulosonic-acid transferase